MIYAMYNKRAQNYFDRLEFHLANHCNLNCAYCNHYSPLWPASFSNPEQVRKDLARLAALTGGRIARDIIVLGGEPLLNPDAHHYFSMIRNYSATANIVLVTNGILLPDMGDDFWNACQKEKVEIHISCYPIKLQTEKITDLCAEYNIKLVWDKDGNLNRGNMRREAICLAAGSPAEAFEKCEKRFCNMLKDGKLYPCAAIPYSAPLFKKLNASEHCFEGIDIHKAKDFHEITTKLSQPHDFYGFCSKRKVTEVPWKKHSDFMSEYIDT